jgi:apolipoprotein N-acyltransferase
LAAPFIWIALEFARSNMSFIALPWGLLAHSQYQTPIVIQIASLAGVYGVSFLMVAVNCAVAACVYALFLYRNKKNVWTKGRLALISGTATLFLFSLLYGNLLSSKPFSGEPLKLALIQGNIDQSQKWDPKNAGVIMRTYAELSLEVSKHKPDLIVWPETATPRAISMDPGVYREVKRIVNLTGTNLLLGSSQPQKFKKPGSKNFKYYNSAFLITPGSPKSKPQRYDKIRLFPFGEYLPYRDSIPWASISVPDVSSYVAGTEFKLFELPPHRFGVTICWENMFPDLFRQFVKNGAQFMVNLTNEAWFGKTEAPYQFLSMSVFRAVENRIFVVRCTNTGISCFIDPNGRVYDRVEGLNGEDTFIRGFKVASIVPQNSKTLYTRYGDWLIWVSMPVLLVIMGIAVIGKKHRKPQ